MCVCSHVSEPATWMLVTQILLIKLSERPNRLSRPLPGEFDWQIRKHWQRQLPLYLETREKPTGRFRNGKWLQLDFAENRSGLCDRFSLPREAQGYCWLHSRTGWYEGDRLWPWPEGTQCGGYISPLGSGLCAFRYRATCGQQKQDSKMLLCYLLGPRWVKLSIVMALGSFLVPGSHPHFH